MSRLEEIKKRLEAVKPAAWDIIGSGDGERYDIWRRNALCASIREHDDAIFFFHSASDIEWLLEELAICKREIERLRTEEEPMMRRYYRDYLLTKPSPELSFEEWRVEQEAYMQQWIETGGSERES